MSLARCTLHYNIARLLLSLLQQYIKWEIFRWFVIHWTIAKLKQRCACVCAFRIFYDTPNHYTHSDILQIELNNDHLYVKKKTHFKMVPSKISKSKDRAHTNTATEACMHCIQLPSGIWIINSTEYLHRKLT